jgi:hypothetical protein
LNEFERNTVKNDDFALWRNSREREKRPDGQVQTFGREQRVIYEAFSVRRTETLFEQMEKLPQRFWELEPVKLSERGIIGSQLFRPQRAITRKQPLDRLCSKELSQLSLKFRFVLARKSDCTGEGTRASVEFFVESRRNLLCLQSAKETRSRKHRSKK